jgi:hypothetical protein
VRQKRQKRQKVPSHAPACGWRGIFQFSKLLNQEHALSGPYLRDDAVRLTSRNDLTGKHAMDRMAAQGEVRKKHVEAGVVN